MRTMSRRETRGMIFEFDTCVLDTSKQELWRDGEPAHVEPQVLAVLEYLVTNSERVVTKIELLDDVWGDRFVSESALTSRIKLARKACGDNGREQRILKTVHSRGYRFIAPVRLSDVSHRAVEPSSPPAVSAPLSSAPSSPSAPPAVPSRQRPVMPPASVAVVGRSDELALLDEAFADVFHGHRRAVFVCGGIGAGKSTLVAEVLERQGTASEEILIISDPRDGLYFVAEFRGGHRRDEVDLIDLRDGDDQVCLANTRTLEGVGVHSAALDDEGIERALEAAA